MIVIERERNFQHLYNIELNIFKIDFLIFMYILPTTFSIRERIQGQNFDNCLKN